MSSISITVKTLGELRELLDGEPDEAMLLINDGHNHPRLNLNFVLGECDTIFIEHGEESE